MEFRAAKHKKSTMPSLQCRPHTWLNPTTKAVDARLGPASLEQGTGGTVPRMSVKTHTKSEASRLTASIRV